MESVKSEIKSEGSKTEMHNEDGNEKLKIEIEIEYRNRNRLNFKMRTENLILNRK